MSRERGLGEDGRNARTADDLPDATPISFKPVGVRKLKSKIQGGLALAGS